MLHSPDVRTTNHGTIVALEPLTDEAKRWFDDNLETEPWQWLGPSIHIDPRNAGTIIQALLDDGLWVQ